MNTDSTTLRKACEKNGIFWAREQLRALPNNAGRQAVQEWIADFETREKTIRDQVRARLIAGSQSGGMALVERPRVQGRLAKINAMEDFGNLLDVVSAMFRW